MQARAAAIKARADADVAAMKAQTDATVAATKAHAEAAKAQTDADVFATYATTAMTAVPIVCGVVAVAALAADFYLHESPAHIKRQMMRTLRACRLPPSVATTPSMRLFVPQMPLTLGFLPTLLLGPTGSGKSTLLADIARKAVSSPSPAPTVLVRMRLPSTRRGRKADADTRTSPLKGKALMDATAAQIFAQIGYPLRRSFIGMLLSRGIVFQGQRTQAELAMPESGDRLIVAFHMLFDVCEQLQAERVSQGMTPLDAAPVLLFDEIQDLIKDARLKNAGGDLVFASLGTLLVAYGVDRHAVRSAAAGSSAEVYFAFSKVSPARGARFNYFDLGDPSVDDMVGALQERGYTSEEAGSMVALCGTRLRLFDKPLWLGAASFGAATFLEASTANAAADFAEVFSELGDTDAAELARLLDVITAIDAQGSASVRRPIKESLSEAVRRMDLAPIIYVNRVRELYFQSQLHLRTWPLVRDKYAVERARLV